MIGVFFFFFKQKTAYEIYQCDWSSDVCSSDLIDGVGPYKVDEHLGEIVDQRRIGDTKTRGKRVLSQAGEESP